MKIFFNKIFFIITLGIVGCSNNSKIAMNNCCNVNNDHKKIADYYFYGKYHSFTENLNRGGVKMSNLFIKGKSLSVEEFTKIDQKIKLDWKLVYSDNNNNFNVYCKDAQNELSILKPESTEVYSKFGEKLYLIPEDVGNWVVALQYNEDGTRYCAD